ncbi:N-acetyltransferase family protein [Corallincola platygyrae]|uniref:N-acetyltransferase family protein n=1 Tax=Corallincola platygyrae TaxID=1193278 RepID=A0ABW4XJG4_9GAMM
MLKIRSFSPDDFPRVQAIYAQGIATGNATFQTKAKTWQEWDNGLRPDCRLIAEIDGAIVGWAALSPVSSRSVYAGVAEVSIYIDSSYGGRGIGMQLLAELVAASEQHGIWTLQAGIFPENQASIAIHHKNGFKQLGVREKLGQMNGKWRDVVLMERRSKVVGVS